jgi:hypothetical protein
MSLPGFTAEASLHKMGKHYHAADVYDILTGNVIPATPCCDACISGCFWDDHLDARCLNWCVKHCHVCEPNQGGSGCHRVGDKIICYN